MPFSPYLPKRGPRITLIEWTIILAIVGIILSIAIPNCMAYMEKQSCLRGHYEETGNTVCLEPYSNYCAKYGPERIFICDQRK